MGMAHKDIPDMLGRVLSGTKYGVKQTRGKFGLGAKMALIWSKMSTGLPVEILSARHNQSFVSFYKLDIDIHKYVYHPSPPQDALDAAVLVNVALQGLGFLTGMLANGMNFIKLKAIDFSPTKHGESSHTKRVSALLLGRNEPNVHGIRDAGQ